MAPTCILKIPPSDHNSPSVLAQATRTGDKPLDVRLVATEGEAPYVYELRHDRADSLRVADCPVSKEEWYDILGYIIEHGETPEDVEVTATVDPEQSITLTIRRRVQEITQRLGAINLHYASAERIELFDWCGSSVDAMVKATEAASSAVAKAIRLETTLLQLRVQLDEIVQAKIEDEKNMFLKFRDLLNEKKLRIRQQQRLIYEFTNGNVYFPPYSPSLESLDDDDDEVTLRMLPFNPLKRKSGSGEDRDSDEGPEDADLDLQGHILKVESTKSEEEENSQGTASTASDDDVDEPAPRRSRRRGPETASASASNTASAGEEAEGKGVAIKEATDAPPIRRQLPFGSPKATRAVIEAGEEEGSDDDEL